MFDNPNPYFLRIEAIGGITHYFVSFVDGQALSHETEVSRPVYLEFLRFVKAERRLRRWDERHIEQSDLTDETIYRRALLPSKSAEEAAFDSMRNKDLRLAIQLLPEPQRRRFVLYHEFGFTYQQIADMEGCSFQAVAKAIKGAELAIKIFLIQG